MVYAVPLWLADGMHHTTALVFVFYSANEWTELGMPSK